jgi:uncharacterized alkaline shock family protein YloU
VSWTSTGPASLTVTRQVIVETVGLAAIEVPGVIRVGRGGPPWRRLGRPAVVVRRRGDEVDVRLWVVARPNQPLVGLAREVQATVGAAIERLLGLRLGSATVVIDGVGT